MDGSVVQLKLPLDLDIIIPEDDSVRLLRQIVEELDLTDLYQTYSRIRENQASPKELLLVVIYGYMNGIYSSRPLELACKRDINFMFLLDGKPAPDHTTLSRFKSLHFSLIANKIMAKVTNLLYEYGEISGDAIFIDGTKIEANANRYSFVWTKTTTKNMAKRLQRAADFVAKCEELYGIKLIYHSQVKLHHLKKLRKKLYRIKKTENITFVYGSGKRKSTLQRSIEELEECLDKLKDYSKKLHIAGTRGSYSKTDEDATFMRMKEDHMRNGQLKPAYNLQHGVDSEYIVWLTISQLATDTNTLKPFIGEMENHLDFKYQKIVADAGYESEENYVFLEENKQLAFIKPSNYEISKTRKYQADLGRIENMSYDPQKDVYICRNEKYLVNKGTTIGRSKSGYVSEKTRYECEDCNNCSYKSECMKGNNWKTPKEERTKKVKISKEFIRLRKENLKRIVSDEGIKLRVNRSIQAEGSFAQTKEDMGFRRFLTRGTANVLTESTLLALGHNINKLHRKIQNDRMGTHLFPVKISV